MRTAAMLLCLACASCGSEAKPRAPEAAPKLEPCAGLVGRWMQVEPIDGTTLEEPKDGKVRPISGGTRFHFEPRRVTVVSATERSESSLVCERAAANACVLHARDSKGRPLDVEATLVTDSLLRMHNIAEPLSPATLYERE